MVTHLSKNAGSVIFNRNTLSATALILGLTTTGLIITKSQKPGQDAGESKEQGNIKIQIPNLNSHNPPVQMEPIPEPSEKQNFDAMGNDIDAATEQMRSNERNQQPSSERTQSSEPTQELGQNEMSASTQNEMSASTQQPEASNPTNTEQPIIEFVETYSSSSNPSSLPPENTETTNVTQATPTEATPATTVEETNTTAADQPTGEENLDDQTESHNNDPQEQQTQDPSGQQGQGENQGGNGEQGGDSQGQSGEGQGDNAGSSTSEQGQEGTQEQGQSGEGQGQQGGNSEYSDPFEGMDDDLYGDEHDGSNPYFANDITSAPVMKAMQAPHSTPNTEEEFNWNGGIEDIQGRLLNEINNTQNTLSSIQDDLNQKQQADLSSFTTTVNNASYAIDRITDSGVSNDVLESISNSNFEPAAYLNNLKVLCTRLPNLIANQTSDPYSAYQSTRSALNTLYTTVSNLCSNLSQSSTTQADIDSALNTIINKLMVKVTTLAVHAFFDDNLNTWNTEGQQLLNAIGMCFQAYKNESQSYLDTIETEEQQILELQTQLQQQQEAYNQFVDNTNGLANRLKEAYDELSPEDAIIFGNMMNNSASWLINQSVAKFLERLSTIPFYPHTTRFLGNALTMTIIWKTKVIKTVLGISTVVQRQCREELKDIYLQYQDDIAIEEIAAVCVNRVIKQMLDNAYKSGVIPNQSYLANNVSIANMERICRLINQKTTLCQSLGGNVDDYLATWLPFMLIQCNNEDSPDDTFILNDGDLIIDAYGLDKTEETSLPRCLQTMQTLGDITEAEETLQKIAANGNVNAAVADLYLNPKTYHFFFGENGLYNIDPYDDAIQHAIYVACFNRLVGNSNRMHEWLAYYLERCGAVVSMNKMPTVQCITNSAILNNPNQKPANAQTCQPLFLTLLPLFQNSHVYAAFQNNDTINEENARWSFNSWTDEDLDALCLYTEWRSSSQLPNTNTVQAASVKTAFDGAYGENAWQQTTFNVDNVPTHILQTAVIPDNELLAKIQQARSNAGTATHLELTDEEFAFLQTNLPLYPQHFKDRIQFYQKLCAEGLSSAERDAYEQELQQTLDLFFARVTGRNFLSEGNSLAKAAVNNPILARAITFHCPQVYYASKLYGKNFNAFIDLLKDVYPNTLSAYLQEPFVYILTRLGIDPNALWFINDLTIDDYRVIFNKLIEFDRAGQSLYDPNTIEELKAFLGIGTPKEEVPQLLPYNTASQLVRQAINRINNANEWSAETWAINILLSNDPASDVAKQAITQWLNDMAIWTYNGGERPATLIEEIQNLPPDQLRNCLNQAAAWSESYWNGNLSPEENEQKKVILVNNMLQLCPFELQMDQQEEIIIVVN